MKRNLHILSERDDDKKTHSGTLAILFFFFFQLYMDGSRRRWISIYNGGIYSIYISLAFSGTLELHFFLLLLLLLLHLQPFQTHTPLWNIQARKIDDIRDFCMGEIRDMTAFCILDHGYNAYMKHLIDRFWLGNFRTFLNWDLNTKFFFISSRFYAYDNLLFLFYRDMT
ncbi:hypothetical protein V8C26DRAFT_56250 [Trichoderma gracile]